MYSFENVRSSWFFKKKISFCKVSIWFLNSSNENSAPFSNPSLKAVNSLDLKKCPLKSCQQVAEDAVSLAFSIINLKLSFCIEITSHQSSLRYDCAYNFLFDLLILFDAHSRFLIETSLARRA